MANQVPPLPPVPPVVPPDPPVPHATPFTVCDAMVLCGIDNITQFDGKTAAQRFTEDVFDESFDSCMDKTFTDLEADFKSYASMTLAQGQLRFYQESKTK